MCKAACESADEQREEVYNLCAVVYELMCKWIEGNRVCNMVAYNM